MASIFFEKVLKTVCFDCEMLLFWQKLLEAVCFGQTLFLGIAGKNSRFCQNSLTYRDSVMVIFRLLGQNGLKLDLRPFPYTKYFWNTKRKISSEFTRKNKP